MGLKKFIKDIGRAVSAPFTNEGSLNLILLTAATGGSPELALALDKLGVDIPSLFSSGKADPLEQAPGPPDPYDIMLRESALAAIRTKQRGGRALTFHTGPRGLQGPARTVIG